MRAFLVPAGTSLRAEFDKVNPHRDHSSDGWIGDAAHAARVSDHNPRGDGSVLALDVDVDGVPMAKIVAFIVARCRSGRETRLQYVIFRRVIWSRAWGWKARHYQGVNPHIKHAHFSFRDGAARGGAWGIAAEFGPAARPVQAAPKPAGKPTPGKATSNGHRPGTRTLKLTDPPMSGVDVTFVQDWIGPAWCGKADGRFGPQTAAGVKRYQRLRHLTPDCIVGPKTWRQFGVRYTGPR